MNQSMYLKNYGNYFFQSPYSYENWSKLIEYINEHYHIIDCAEYAKTLVRVFIFETYSEQIEAYVI